MNCNDCFRLAVFGEPVGSIKKCSTCGYIYEVVEVDDHGNGKVIVYKPSGSLSVSRQNM
jgi:hypothetical protein